MNHDHGHLVIAGVPKAGTTSLFEHLAQHPGIYPSRVRQTAFFKEPGGDVGDYLRHFRGATDERWLMESTPGYLARGRAVAERLRELLPGVRVLVSLRDPVDRFVSHYRMKARAGGFGPHPPSLLDYVRSADDTSTPGQAANVLAAGRYVEHLPAWQGVLGPSLRIVFFDHLVADTAEQLRDVCVWLDLAPEEVDRFDLSPRNRGVGHRSRGVARVAQGMSHGLRPVFQRFPGSRGWLRSLHDAVNPARPQDVVLEDLTAAREQLADRYAMATAELAAWLSSTGHTHLPAWLGAPGPTTPHPLVTTP